MKYVYCLSSATFGLYLKETAAIVYHGQKQHAYTTV